MLTILIIGFVVFTLIRTPIAIGLGLSALAAIVFASDLPLAAIPHKMVNMIDSYVFLAIPLFLFAGRLMNEGGITERIFHFARLLVGSIRGGLAHATVVTGVIFSWMTGSAVAAVGALGEINLKAFRDNGYDKEFASTVTIASSVLGPVIPPSIPLIIFAAMSENSVGKLFLGAVVPGLILALGLMVLIFVISKKRDYPKDATPAIGEVLVAFRSAVVPLLLPVIMLGGIATGIFTPTEAAAVAGLYAFIISMFVYRSVKWRNLPSILVDTMVGTAIITFIISMTSTFSFIMALEDAGAQVINMVSYVTDNKYVVLLLINIILLVFGALMEAGVVLILFIPIFYPLAISLGIDPIHFGVIMVVNLMIGVATPPMGVSLFMMSHISGIKVELLMKKILIFLTPMLFTLIFITYYPDLVTFLPNLLMK